MEKEFGHAKPNGSLDIKQRGVIFPFGWEGEEECMVKELGDKSWIDGGTVV